LAALEIIETLTRYNLGRTKEGEFPKKARKTGAPQFTSTGASTVLNRALHPLWDGAVEMPEK